VIHIDAKSLENIDETTIQELDANIFDCIPWQRTGKLIKSYFENIYIIVKA
jgi:hypothetical protein